MLAFLKKNVPLLSVGGAMVLIYFASGTYNNFITLYYTDIGITPGQLGIISAMGPIATLLFQTAWGKFADRIGRKNVLYIGLAGSGLSVLLFLLSKEFLPIIGISLLYTVFTMAINPISDSATIDFCNREGYNFGPVRLCGTIGFALAPLIWGALFTRDMNLMFPIYTGLCVLSGIAVITMPKWLNETAKQPQGEGKKADKGAIRLAVRDPIIFYVLALNFCLSLGSNFLQYFPMLARNMGYSTNTIGLLNSLSTFSEIPALLMIGWVVKKIRSEKIMYSAVIFSALRLGLLYASSFVPQAAMALFVMAKLLQSVTFVTNYYCSANLLHERFPDHMKATAQTLLAVVSSGAARIIGSLASGAIADWIGIENTFGVGGAFMIVSAVGLGILLARILKKEKENKNELEPL